MRSAEGRGSVGQERYLPIATVGRDETSFQETGLNPYEWYTYVVVAFKDSGELGGYSDWSNEAGATTGPTPE